MYSTWSVLFLINIGLFLCLSSGIPVVFIVLWIGSRVYFEDTESVFVHYNSLLSRALVPSPMVEIAVEPSCTCTSFIMLSFTVIWTVVTLSPYRCWDINEDSPYWWIIKGPIVVSIAVNALWCSQLYLLMLERTEQLISYVPDRVNVVMQVDYWEMISHEEKLRVSKLCMHWGFDVETDCSITNYLHTSLPVLLAWHSAWQRSHIYRMLATLSLVKAPVFQSRTFFFFFLKLAFLLIPVHAFLPTGQFYALHEHH